MYYAVEGCSFGICKFCNICNFDYLQLRCIFLQLLPLTCSGKHLALQLLETGVVLGFVVPGYQIPKPFFYFLDFALS